MDPLRLCNEFLRLTIERLGRICLGGNDRTRASRLIHNDAGRLSGNCRIDLDARHIDSISRQKFNSLLTSFVVANTTSHRDGYSLLR